MNRSRFLVSAEDETQVDITPMLDVVFIMLIFFIVTSTFVKESGVDVTRPDAETAVKTDALTFRLASLQTTKYGLINDSLISVLCAQTLKRAWQKALVRSHYRGRCAVEYGSINRRDGSGSLSRGAEYSVATDEP